MGANIMLDGTMLGAASDENGHYIITNIPIGRYTLKAMFIGYETLKKKVRVSADQQYVIDLSLKPSAIELWNPPKRWRTAGFLGFIADRNLVAPSPHYETPGAA